MTLLQLRKWTNQDLFLPKLKAKTASGVLNELAGLISKRWPAIDAETIATALKEREKLGSTGLEEGVAIPHAKADVPDIIIAAGIKHEGIKFGAQDGKPSQIFFVLLAPNNSSSNHLRALAKLSRILKNTVFRNRLFEAQSAKEMYDLLMSADGKG